MIVTSGRAALAYSVDGVVGDGADVLLLHAGVTDRRSWRPLVEAIGHGRRCISYDARGFGETTYETEDYHQHDDALAVLDAVGVNRVVVIGASMGGKASINLALEHPERVHALVLIGPAIAGAPTMEEYPEPIATFDRLLGAAEEAGDLSEVNRLEAHLWLDGPSAAEGRVSGLVRDLFLEMNGRALGAPDPGDEPSTVDAWARLEELAMPVLVLVGTLDLPDIKGHARVLAKRVPHGRLVVLEGVAHLPHLESDETCLRAVADFLDEFPRVRPTGSG